ncbi:MAG: TIGR00282 family metallophosphoesterase [Acholeplasmataceae bacterium]|nr:TIGR00282 family metallophosphoesterase [Acholeplasmataceae bacterium]
MNILFIGDIYGKPGIDILRSSMATLRETYRPNLIIANGENATKGRGLDKKTYKILMETGIHALTMGNWVWGQFELFDFIEGSNVIRPANFPDAPGKGYQILNFNGVTVMVINLLGRTFMNPNINCPFKTMDELLANRTADYVIVDIHAEATSEKVALGHYLDGRVDAVLGTHTHVQTADSRVLPKGTLYQTDIGMTGPMDGVIGVKKEIVLDRFIKGFARPNEIGEGATQLNAVLLDLKARTIERIHIEAFEAGR